MQRLQDTSKVRVKSGRIDGPPKELAGDDYLLDGIAPDDLPVRDIREDEMEWHSPDGPRAEAHVEEQGQSSADAHAVHRGSLEVLEAASENVSSPPPCSDHQPTPEAPVPGQQAEAEPAADLVAQSLLPGLEADFLSGHSNASTRMPRPRRQRAAFNKRALRAAQIELWPQTDISGSET
jgi:hypothetical protein